MNLEALCWWLVILVVGAPAIAMGLLILFPALMGRQSEKFVRGVVSLTVILEVLSSCAVTLCYVLLERRGLPVPKVELSVFSVESSMNLMLDALSLPFFLVTVFLTSVVAVFALNYLRWERGYSRFFLLFLMFLLGMHFIFLGGSFETIFIGWELIGLTSALLISFFFSTVQAVENAQRAFWAYRLSDIGLLVGAVMLAHAGHHGAFAPVGWFASQASSQLLLSGWELYVIPLLIVVPALGKSAQIPFTQWLPRAMEGPTPSSAVFYGALSVHAGVFLCLRLLQEVAVPIMIPILLVIIGLATAIYATFLGYIQGDIKGKLAYASMAQVGLMMAELGFGFRWLVILHFIGHAMLRTYQLLYALSWIHEHQEIWKPVQVEQMGSAKLTRRFAASFHFALSEGWSNIEPTAFLERISSSIRKSDEGFRRFLVFKSKWFVPWVE